MAKSKAKKKKKSTRGGIGAYIRKINNAPAVKRIRKKITALESKLKKEKRDKERAVKKAQIAYRKKHK